MSRCRACNTMMTDAEMRRKDPNTGDYADMCSTCFMSSLDIYVKTGGNINDVDTLQFMEGIGVSFDETYDILRGIQYEFKVPDTKDNY